MKKFTEQQTRDYYNEEDKVYQSLWSSDGNLHWGYFTDESMSLEDAMVELDKKMLSLSGVHESSKVLDVGCGNGNNSIYINKITGAEVTGLDLSDIRVENAKKNAQETEGKVSFIQGSAIELPFEDESFTHVWSQSAIYHVHEKEKALKEIYRVLKKGGVFIFEDITKPKKEVSAEAREHVYDRLLFDTDFDAVSYQKELEDLGFHIEFVENMSHHFAHTYSYLADKIQNKLDKGENPEFHEDYRKLLISYAKTPVLVEKEEVGWMLMMAVKDSGE